MALAFGSWLQSHLLDFFGSSQLKRSSLYPSTFSIPRFYSQQRSCFIQKLSPEVLGEIFRCLDWEELLAATMTCERWYSIITHQKLWRSLALKLQSEWISTPMEMSLENYVESEIRRWVIRRYTVQTAWFSDKPISLKMTPFNMPDGIVDVEFVPGGRWLLATDKRGRLLGLDLNEPEIKPTILVDPGQGDIMDESSDKLVRFKIWVNPRSSMLSLHVVMWNDWKDRLPPHDEMKTRTLVYQVDLVGYGERTFLTVMPLARWEDPCTSSRIALAFNGMHMVELWSGEKPYLSLLRYSDNKIENIDKERMRVELLPCEDFSDIHLTPNGTILVYGKEHVDFYTIGIVQGQGYKRSLVEPICSVYMTTESCSKPFNLDNDINAKATWVASGGDDDGIDIFGLDPSDGTESILALKMPLFGSKSEKMQRYCTSHAMVTLKKDLSLQILACCSRRDMSYAKETLDLRSAKSISHDDIRIGALDESIGRVILVPRRASDGQTCTLLDIL